MTLQLHPVHEAPTYETLLRKMTDKLMQTLGSAHLWRQLFKYDEFTINMRQKNDLSYWYILSKIRVGIITDADSRTF